MSTCDVIKNECKLQSGYIIAGFAAINGCSNAEITDLRYTTCFWIFKTLEIVINKSNQNL